MNDTCKTCLFFLVESASTGQCRVKHPQVFRVVVPPWGAAAKVGYNYESVFPQVKVTDWCGEWRSAQDAARIAALKDNIAKRREAV